MRLSLYYCLHIFIAVCVYVDSAVCRFSFPYRNPISSTNVVIVYGFTTLPPVFNPLWKYPYINKELQ